MKKLKQLGFLAGTALLSMALLSSCSNSDTESNNSPDTSTNVPATGGEVTPPAGNTPEIQPETSFELPAHYAHLDVGIAYAFSSVQSYMNGSYIPSMPLDPEMLEGMYGISAEMYTEYHGEVPMMSAQADQLIIFKTEDVEGLSGALNEYLEAQRANMGQYPSTMQKLAVAEVVSVDQYVILNMLSGFPENEASMSEEEIKEYYQSMVKETSAEVIRVLEGGDPLPPLVMEFMPEEEFDPNAHLGESVGPSGGELSDPAAADGMEVTPAAPPAPPKGQADMPVEMPAL